ncbi:MAG: Twitching motility protein PilT [Labilithrix sp.]|nr:Twitching motility protein PilT [Labilithrix sp.]
MPKIDALLDDLVKRGGTDLHLAGGYSPLARIRGELAPLREGLVDAKELEEVLFELVSASQRARLGANLDLDFAYVHRELARFRASYFQKSTGLSAVFKLIPVRPLTLAELACPEALWRLADRRHGLVLVAGPTASGKSTTVSALLDHINKTRACHVVTIEAPVEIVHEPLRAQITQREVGSDTASFAAALRTAAREDADVVMVADVSEPEAAALALELAASGRLVIATLPANGAVQALERFVQVFPDLEHARVRGLVADSLAGVVSQQLVRAIDGKGRVAAHEILIGTPETEALVRGQRWPELAALMQSGHASGMQTLDGALERLLAAGRITAQDAIDRAVDRAQLAQAIVGIRPELAGALA